MSFRALAQDEPLPMPPVTVVPPDEAGNCPQGYSKQADGSCKGCTTGQTDIMGTCVSDKTLNIAVIAIVGVVAILLLGGRR